MIKIQLRPVVTEKAVMMIESGNVLTFETERGATKTQIKEEVESIFSVKVEGIRTLVKGSKKYAYVKLNKEHAAIDVATKLGMM